MKLASVFTDGAVLQRDMAIPLWGRAKPGAVVKASLAGKTAFGRASSEGAFMLRLPSLPAGGPHALRVESLDGSEQVELHDVFVGEVWLASGQSNMQFFMKDSPAQFKEFVERNTAPGLLRFLCVKPNPSGAEEDSFDAVWSASSPSAIEEMSAVALWHGLHLRERLNVPVGVISSACGGTCIEAWTSRRTLAGNPDVAPELFSYESWLASTPDNWTAPSLSSAKMNFFRRFAWRDEGDEGFAKGWASPGFDDSAWRGFSVPGSWTKEGLCGLGAVWFRKSVELPASWAGRELLLKLGPVDKHDISYFNGVEIGASGTGFDESFYNKPRAYKVPAGLVKSGRATIAVRASTFIYDGAFGGVADDYSLSLPDFSDGALPLGGEWRAFPEKDCGWSGFPRTRGFDMGPGNPSSFHILFDGNIRPLVPYAIRGAIWYQGEDNAMVEGEQPLYRRKLVDLIKDWRFHWGQGEFPFYVVQLANFRARKTCEPDSLWAPLRESQRLACQDVPAAAFVVTADIGDACDIHPKNKRDVGARLAALALRDIHGFHDAPPPGPRPKSSRRDGMAFRIAFANAFGGLVLKDGAERCFQLLDSFTGMQAGADCVRIEGDELVVSCSKIFSPRKVRYAWADNPELSLFNGAGAPACPFEV